MASNFTVSKILAFKHTRRCYNCGILVSASRWGAGELGTLWAPRPSNHPSRWGGVAPSSAHLGTIFIFSPGLSSYCGQQDNSFVTSWFRETRVSRALCSSHLNVVPSGVLQGREAEEAGTILASPYHLFFCNQSNSSFFLFFSVKCLKKGFVTKIKMKNSSEGDKALWNGKVLGSNFCFLELRGVPYTVLTWLSVPVWAKIIPDGCLPDRAARL